MGDLDHAFTMLWNGSSGCLLFFKQSTCSTGQRNTNSQASSRVPKLRFFLRFHTLHDIQVTTTHQAKASSVMPASTLMGAEAGRCCRWTWVLPCTTACISLHGIVCSGNYFTQLFHTCAGWQGTRVALSLVLLLHAHWYLLLWAVHARTCGRLQKLLAALSALGLQGLRG